MGGSLKIPYTSRHYGQPLDITAKSQRQEVWFPASNFDAWRVCIQHCGSEWNVTLSSLTVAGSELHSIFTSDALDGSTRRCSSLHLNRSMCMKVTPDGSFLFTHLWTAYCIYTLASFGSACNNCCLPIWAIQGCSWWINAQMQLSAPES